MIAKSLTCEDINPLLDAYHDGELDEVERRDVSSHLDACQNCQDKLKGIAGLVTSLKTLPQLQMTQGLTTKMDFLKQAFAIVGCKVESDVGSIRNPQGANDTFEPSPVPRKNNKHRFLNRIFPIPGPVIFAGAAAAAALTLVILVPRMMNPSLTNSTPIANLPKQSSAKLNLDHSEVDFTPGSNIHNNRIEHNGTLSLNQYAVHEPAHSTHFANDSRNVLGKEPHLPDRAPETESAANVDKLPSTEKPKIDLASGDGRPPVSGEPHADEREGSMSGTSPDTSDLLALYPGDSNPTNNELAISTDEDGLYALKL